jgi:predicted amino acid racemase
MGTRMKTTIELSDVLFTNAKKLAQRNNVTMRSLIEEGLRKVIAESSQEKRTSFTLKDARVRGGTMLIKDPKQWLEMDQAHIVSRVSVKKK